ncbi:MAG TPA: universal stress protein, partial [Pseudolysinimonas sp.]|nr:universal stress protein [Pseudolysinimonas sp.]
LDAIHAWTVDVPTLATPEQVVDEATQRLDHREVLSRALDRIRAAYPRVRLRGLLEQRPTSDALSERSGHGQLIVLGSHRWGPIAGLVLGSTARDALRTATAPLCIVPPGAPARSAAHHGEGLVARER